MHVTQWFQVIQGLLQENQLWQQSAQSGVAVNDTASTTFRPSMGTHFHCVLL